MFTMLIVSSFACGVTAVASFIALEGTWWDYGMVVFAVTVEQFLA